jgi:hypothetical protein
MTEIACPTCQKKYRLGDRFPALFTCKGCGTAMDLSSFPGAVASAPAAPVAPAAPAGGAAKAAAGGPSARSSARGGGRGRPESRARAGAAGRRRRGDDAGEGDEEAGGRRGAPPRKGASPALLWGSLGGLVVVVGLLILVLGKKDDPPTDAGKNDSASAPEAPPSIPPSGETPAASGATGTDGAPTEAAPGSSTSAAGTPASPSSPASSTPASSTPAAPSEPAPSGGFPSPLKTGIRAKEHNSEASPEERQRIDALIETAVFVNAGADSREAEEELVKLGYKAAPRLVGVFHRIRTSPEGFEQRMGLMKASIVDRTLRKIDGVMERRFKKVSPIHSASDPKHADKIARYWNWWWDTGEWKKGHKPWDERTEGAAEEEPEEGAGGMGSN